MRLRVGLYERARAAIPGLFSYISDGLFAFLAFAKVACGTTLLIVVDLLCGGLCGRIGSSIFSTQSLGSIAASDGQRIVDGCRKRARSLRTGQMKSPDEGKEGEKVKK